MAIRMNRDVINRTLQDRIPNLLAIYAFGSRIQGTAQPESDLDLAVLVAGHAEPVTLWELAGDLTDLAGCPVDRRLSCCIHCDAIPDHHDGRTLVGQGRTGGAV